jgi:hypothetical protein
MLKGIIYYTDCRADKRILLAAQEYIAASGLPISSCSLKPIDFGNTVMVLDKERSYTTMVEQIILALDFLNSDYVFFCENDVLYHNSHFDFIPERDDTYYYNVNNYRWMFGSKTAITYKDLVSLSALCCNRQLALTHYKYRLELIKERGLDKINTREPKWARQFGYEPGTKKRRRGGVTDEDYMTWNSALPNVDIRHKRTFSPPKVSLEAFRHPPTNWKELPIEQIPGWDLKGLFNL